MTIENYEYRTNPMFLRNQFASQSGKFGIPIVPKPVLEPEDLNALRLLRFDQVARDLTTHRNRMVHFFIYDYLFEKVWKKQEQYVEMLRPYRAVLTPDFSMYTEMPESIQLFNTFRNRWCGAYFASHGLRVIPTVSWGEKTVLSIVLRALKKVQPLLYQHLCFGNMATTLIRKNYSWQATVKCSGELSRRISSVTVSRFRKWKAILSI